MVTQLLFLLLLVANSWQYSEPNKAQFCVSSCQGCYDPITFGTTVETDDWYTGMCKDTLKWESVYLCAKLHCTPFQIQTGLDYATEACHTEVHIDVPSYNSVIANYSNAQIAAMTLIDWDVAITPPTEIYNVTLLPTQEYFRRELKSLVCIPQLVSKVSNVSALMNGDAERVGVCGKSASRLRVCNSNVDTLTLWFTLTMIVAGPY